jgi:hypothetical protein
MKRAIAIAALLTMLGCGPGQHPCVTAYEKARTEAEIAEVDEVCEHMLLVPGDHAGGGGQGGGQ